MGRRNRPYYRLVVADSRARRDGRFIELLGSYDPMKPKADRTVLNEDRILYWLDKGASPSDTVRNILSDHGILLKAHLSDPNLTDAQKSEQLQKYELSKQARMKKDGASASEKSADKAVKEAAPAAEAAVVESAEEPEAEITAEESTETLDSTEGSTDAEPEAAAPVAASENENTTDTVAESTEPADSPEEKPAPAGE